MWIIARIATTAACRGVWAWVRPGLNSTLGVLSALALVFGASAPGPTAYAAEIDVEIVAVSAGGTHSLALDSNGSVWAWGGNGVGQLGDGTTTNRSTPVQVKDPSDPVGLLTHVIAAIASSGYSLALKDDGTVLAWGANGTGQLGDGTNTNRSTPAQVQGLTGVVAIALLGNHSLALKSDGTVWGWGINDVRQLGDGTTVNRIVPVQVQDPTDPTGFLTDIRAIAAGFFHSLAVKADGGVRAWGGNATGAVGDGTSGTPPRPPVQVKDLTDPSGFLTGAVAVTAGNASSYALKADGTVRSWGVNANGQLGDGTTTNRSTAVVIQDLVNVTDLEAGSFHSLARRSDGMAWGWGQNSSGQLADGTATDRLTPVQVKDLSHPRRLFRGAAAVSAGGAHSLFLKDDGGVRAAGTKGVGQLGDGTDALRPLPVQVVDPADPAGFLTGIDAVSAASAVSIAHTSANTIRAWGDNTFGQLGDRTTMVRFVPVQAVEAGVSAVTSGGPHTLAIKADDGTVRAWGLGTRGQLGNGSFSSSVTPVPVAGLVGVVTVAGSPGSFSFAWRSDGTAWAWGQNQFGQLGDNTLTNRSIPVQVKDPADATGFLTRVVAISAGGNHALALLSDRTVRTWGQDNFGQLGDGGTNTNQSIPVAVAGLATAEAIAGGGVHSLALMSDGSVKAWGQNTFGQLGDGTSMNRNIAVQVQGLTNVIALAAGGSHSLALMSDGTVWSWGANGQGQLGDGTFEHRFTPVQVADPFSATGLLTGVVRISAGGGHSLAVMSDGTVRAWGAHALGQIGDGTDPNAVSPVKVRFP